MTEQWAIRFPATKAAGALALRFRRDVEAHDAGSVIWLRGSGRSDDLAAILQKIPDVEQFNVGIDQTVTPFGKRIPIGDLPIGKWVPFSALAALQPQIAALPAKVTDRSAITILRSNFERESSAMLVSLESWTCYATSAPKIRLDALRFAVRSDGLALLVGNPLPAIPGDYFTNAEGIFVPAGYEWRPEIEPALMRKLLSLSDGDAALFALDASYELIAAKSFVPATRANVRQTFDDCSA